MMETQGSFSTRAVLWILDLKKKKITNTVLLSDLKIFQKTFLSLYRHNNK